MLVEPVCHREVRSHSMEGCQFCAFTDRLLFSSAFVTDCCFPQLLCLRHNLSICSKNVLVFIMWTCTEQPNNAFGIEFLSFNYRRWHYSMPNIQHNHAGTPLYLKVVICKLATILIKCGVCVRPPDTSI